MNPPPAEGFSTRFFAGPALRAQPDRRLVTLVREGYESAFEEIVRRYAKPLGRYAAGIVGSRSEDVTQDAFSKALVALRRDTEADIELRPWLYRIVRNTALNDLRDGPPASVELADDLGGGSRSAAEEFERREDLEELLERLRELPDPQRAAIVMRELEGLGHEEIAKSLGVSGGAARQAIFRARQALRDAAGFLIPLPVLRLLLEHGAEAGVAAGAGGAAVAAGAGGAAGAGTALKVGVVTAVLAGSVGTGLAIKDRSHERDAETAAAATVPAASGGGSAVTGGGASSGTGAGGGEAGDDRGGDGGGEAGGSVSDNDDFDSSGTGSGGDRGPHHSGQGRGDDGPHHGGRGPGPSGDRGSRGPGPGDDDGGHHGPGGGGGGHHGSGHEGSGGGPGPSGGNGGGGGGSGGSGGGGDGGPGSGAFPPPESGDDDNSGHGSGEDSGSEDNSGEGSGAGGAWTEVPAP